MGSEHHGSIPTSLCLRLIRYHRVVVESEVSEVSLLWDSFYLLSVVFVLFYMLTCFRGTHYVSFSFSMFLIQVYIKCMVDISILQMIRISLFPIRSFIYGHYFIMVFVWVVTHTLLYSLIQIGLLSPNQIWFFNHYNKWYNCLISSFKYTSRVIYVFSTNYFKL